MTPSPSNADSRNAPAKRIRGTCPGGADNLELWAHEWHLPTTHNGGNLARLCSHIVDAIWLAVPLAIFLILAGTVLAGFYLHGVYSMYSVFGTEEARHILAESANAPWRRSLDIALALLSRTCYLVHILGPITAFFLASYQRDQKSWPPSAAITFTALPYIGSLYNATYEGIFGRLGREWIAEAQLPEREIMSEMAQQQAETRSDAGTAAADVQNLKGKGQEMVLGLRSMVKLMQDNGQEAPQRDIQPLNDSKKWNGITSEVRYYIGTALGALVFPAISSFMGMLLNYGLRRYLVASPSLLDQLSLLQTRWGRSVVGGCLFVLFKDTLILYESCAEASQKGTSTVISNLNNISLL